MSDTNFSQNSSDCGLDDDIINKLLDLDKSLFANLEWDVDFKHNPSNCREFIFSDGRPFSTLIFGEITPAGPVGTIHSAIGNHYAGSSNTNFLPVTDASKIKDVFMLRCPSNATAELRLLYEYQLSNLNKLRDTDAVMEDNNGTVVTNVTEIIRSQDPYTQPNLIATHFGPKYVVPESLASKTRALSSRKTNKPKRVYAERDKTSTHNDNTTTATPPSDISVGDLYNPQLLPDYGGPMFQHNFAKLIQRHVYDEDGNLIAPWDMYEKMKPGTIVLMKVQLVVFEMKDKQKDGVRKFYQFHVERIHVLAPSEEEAEIPQQAKLPTFYSHDMKATGKRDATDDALDSLFAVKTKKKKTDLHLTDGQSSYASTSASTSTQPINSELKAKTVPRKKVNKGKGKMKDTAYEQTTNEETEIRMDME